MNVLVIAPHPDDESLGCGGSLCHHADAGDRLAAVYLTSGELGLKHLSPEEARAVREGEARAAAKLLGIAECVFMRFPDWQVADCVTEAVAGLRPILRAEMPGLIYLPHPDEWHPDHRPTPQIVREALRAEPGCTPVQRLYEVWTPLGTFDHVEDISDVMERKLKAVRAHQSQLTEFAYDEAMSGLNAYRGVLAARSRYAEVFQIVQPDGGPGPV